MIRIFIGLILFPIGIINLMAQSDIKFKIDAIPHELRWNKIPAEYSFSDGKLSILAGPKTDLFIDPRGGYTFLNSPRCLFEMNDYFQLASKVKVDFKTDYDAGVLIVYLDDNHWAKLCFEYSPQGQPMVVSVVTNDNSDDANGSFVEGNEVYLRVSGLKGAFAFHYSADGKSWNLVRYFSLRSKEPVNIGFSSQSPTGESCKSVFSDIVFKKEQLKELRDGS